MNHAIPAREPYEGNGESTQQRVSLGVRGTCREPDGGVEVVELLPGGPADAAGIEHGDTILSIEVRDTADLSCLLNGTVAGNELVLKVLRGNRNLLFRVRPEAWSEEEENRAYDRLMAAQAKAHRVPWWTKWYTLWGILER